MGRCLPGRNKSWMRTWWSARAAARNSIGITIVAGMTLGTLFTLLVIPSIYVLIAKQHAGEERGAIGRNLELAETAPDGIVPAVEVATN